MSKRPTRLDRTVKNWRWWVAIIPLLASVGIQFALLLLAVVGEWCRQAQELIERLIFRPLHGWARAGIRAREQEEGHEQ